MSSICLIAAVGENRVIGSHGTIPWHLPVDFKHFKEITMGYPIVMGRKTFESIGKPLPGRTNIVITRDQNYSRDGIVVVHSLDEALAHAAKSEKTFVLGGGEIFEMAMPKADTIYLTQVHGMFEGDAFFPKIDAEEWEILDVEPHKKDEKNPFDFDFLTYRKRTGYNGNT